MCSVFEISQNDGSLMSLLCLFQRNEKVLTYCPQLQLHSPVDEHSLSSTSAMETIKYEEKTTSQKLFRYSPNQRFGVEICRPTSDCLSYNYIPEQAAVNSNSAENISTNHDRQVAPFHKDVSLVDSVAKNAKHSLGGGVFLDIRAEGKNSHNWDLCTSSTITLRDETINGENDSQCKNSVSRGSTFSLNDILDGDIEELQLSIQSQEGTKDNTSTGNTNNINPPGYGLETAQHQDDCQQQNSKPLMFMGDTKATSALQTASDSCEKIFKQQKEPPQVPFSRASGIYFDNFGVAKQKTAAEKRLRYSYPAALPVKSALNSEMHKTYCAQTENSTGVKMAEASKALQTVTKTKQAVQLWNFETFFDESDTEKLGTIKERTVPVTGSQPQISEHEVGLSGVSAEQTDTEKAINKNAKISASVQGDILHKDASQRFASDENPEKWNLTQESVSEENTSNRSPALQNLSQRNLVKETQPNLDTYTSGGNPLLASPPHSNAVWGNNVPGTLHETNHSEDTLFDPSHAMHMIKQQDTANKQSSRPNHCDYHPQQVIKGSEERKHEQSDIIPAESVDIRPEMESIIQKKRERFDSTSNENTSKDVAKDVNMSKDKVMALTAYFEEVHVEQCPDCQQSGTRCKKSSAYSLSLGSKDNSLSEDDSMRMDGNTVIDLDQNQREKSQDDATEIVKTGTKHHFVTNETLASPSLVSETSKCEAASACDTSVQGTARVISDACNVSANVSVSDSGLKVSMNSRGKSNEATDSQIEGTLLKDEIEEINKTEPEQFKRNFISSVGESKSVTKKIENTEDHKDRDLKMCLLGRKNLTTTSVEELVRKRSQWKSLPSVSTADSHPTFQVKYIRTLSLKSFSDALTPPPSPKLHKEDENTKRVTQAYGLTQECSEDLFNIHETAQEPQHETYNQQSDQPQGSSQSNTKTLSEKQAHDPTEGESQGCLQSYVQVQSQGHSQAKQFTVFSDDKCGQCCNNYL